MAFWPRTFEAVAFDFWPLSPSPKGRQQDLFGRQGPDLQRMHLLVFYSHG